MKGTSPGARRHTARGAWLRIAILAVALTLLMAGSASAAGANDYDLYFGDLHSHTSYSDGTGVPEDAYSAAYAAALAGQIDFFGTTDHTHYPYGAGFTTAESWADTLAVADKYYHPGVFATLPGYEQWLPWMTVGEMNVYNTTKLYGDPFNPAGNGTNNGHKRGVRRLVPYLYDWLAAEGAVGQWNHPDYYGGDTSNNYDWYQFGFYTPQRDEAVSMIEVWNEITYENAYLRALDAGWHVLPSANSDTHYADWVTGCDVRTVLLARHLTRQDLVDAMRNSRGYATEDKNLEIRYTVDGAVMGSILAPKASYQASIHISDPDLMGDEIKLVEIVADGGEVVASQGFDDNEVTWEPTLSSVGERYFFVRVTTASDFWGNEGVTAWTAPVWTGR